METTKNIYQRLNAVMSEVSYIQKLDKKVNNMYRFVAHDQVVAKLQPQLVKHGILVAPSVMNHTRDGNMTILEVAVCFINIDNPTDCITVTAIGYGVDPGDKGPGKAMSYAVKYALLKTFCLETGDDPDYEPEAKYEKETVKDADDFVTAFINFKMSHRRAAGEEELCKQYLNKYATHYKKTLRETCNVDYEDINKFDRDFDKWKSQQPKSS